MNTIIFWAMFNCVVGGPTPLQCLPWGGPWRFATNQECEAMRDHMGPVSRADPDPRLGNATLWKVKCFGWRGDTWIDGSE